VVCAGHGPRHSAGSASISLVIELTPVAADKLRELRRDDPAKAVLRLYVAGKSCCSTRYGLAFDDGADPQDIVSELEGIPVAIDPLSAPHCEGATIDFVDSPSGAGFFVRGAATGGGCACGR